MADFVPGLRKSVRALLADEKTFREVFNRAGKLHIEGMGSNQITKILTVHNRQKWPILNKRVWKTMMSYGYLIDWSASGYLRFARDLRNCMKGLGTINFWALDAFCLAKSKLSD